jgi:hypothetical protein
VEPDRIDIQRFGSFTSTNDFLDRSSSFPRRRESRDADDGRTFAAIARLDARPRGNDAIADQD